jgi:hypothetical protein
MSCIRNPLLFKYNLCTLSTAYTLEHSLECIRYKNKYTTFRIKKLEYTATPKYMKWSKTKELGRKYSN